MTPRVRVERYRGDDSAIWDKFVDDSKNGTFLFARNYLDYHAARFVDHSLLFFEQDRLIAIMPATQRDSVLSSHAGLTFGGIISDQRMKAAVMLELFNRLHEYLHSQQITHLAYKPVPYIYHVMPADEDLYALFRHGARLARRDLSSAVANNSRQKLSKGRRWSVQRASRRGVEIRASRDFRAFMAISQVQLMTRHATRPTHSGDEMQLLADRFPDNIKLFGAYRDEVLLGGVIMYGSRRVAHVQYIAASDDGREFGVVDGVLGMLLNETYAAVPYFDFGISTEDAGRYLNAGLIAQKEGFGARSVAYDAYELDIT